ncbi:MAG: hypothetical protein H0V73_10430 [Chloroflexi bacterium]|nr:hypothetical protein [Chloroflexota bacterium]
MTVNAARRTRRSPASPQTPIIETPESTYAPDPTYASYVPSGSFAIGEIGQTVFDCPSCSRPLALGERRCPGCRTRLVNGVVIRKASTFVALGLAVGLVGGGAIGLRFGLGQHAAGGGPGPIAAVPGTAPAGGVTPSLAPASTAPPARTPAPPTGSDVPPAARASLGQVAGMFGRLRVARDDLQRQVAGRVLDTSAVARTLRAVSAESLFGQQLATRISAWPRGTAVGSDLATFYGSIHDTAARGLVASVRNEAAYRSAALLMIELLDGIDGINGIDASVQSTAAAAGLTLPEPTAAP